jgi:L-ascorbate metabolism protein UlaG (beta-lactamase superfamily)
VGHATVLIEVDGFRVVTDPLLRRRVVHLRRRSDLPIEPIRADLILISHAHMDHLHLPSLRMLDRATPVVTPRGTTSLLRAAGFRHVVEVVPGDRVEVGRAVLDVTPAVHKTGRGPHRRLDSPALGYVIDVDGHRTYFAGDTDLFDAMGDLTDIDLALLPIWGWGPTIGIGHLNPERAAEAAELIQPGLVVPVHWGTYAPEDLRRKPPAWLDQPARDFETMMARAGTTPVLVLEPGGAVDLST